ncbi:nucleotide-binding protein [Pseudomonas carnis]|uniref:nucleotide-binding protein n=1 Tax=Pseudomonas carnis TaxID=2487355 RepID=UPI002164C861|nr:nucleotide-binding protein [Pseudomonas carnis]
MLKFGYFLGYLGRERVCALKRGQVEIPSDFAGGMRTAKSSTQPCKAKTWCALTFKWAPVLAF